MAQITREKIEETVAQALDRRNKKRVLTLMTLAARHTEDPEGFDKTLAALRRRLSSGRTNWTHARMDAMGALESLPELVTL